MNPQSIPWVIEKVRGMRIIVKNAGRPSSIFLKSISTHALEHRRADQHQHRRRRVRRNHAGQRRDEEAWQKTKRREHRGQSGASTAVNARDAFDVSSARRRARQSGAESRK